MTRLVLGVDSSTQSTKVEVRDAQSGAVVAVASAPHPPTLPPVSEQDPRAWWGALRAACQQLGDVRSSVVAMSVAGQQHGLVLLDEAGSPVRPAKLWNDTTSAREAEALKATFGADELARLVGSVPVASFTVTKLAWMLANEPRCIGQVARIMLPHDYLTWRLTGAHVTDRGDASGTGWWSPTSGAYVPEVLDHLGAAGRNWMAQLPRVLAPTEVAGEITADAAYALGLPEGVTVGPGTGDNMAGALGLGLAPGDVVLSLGTSGVAYGVSDEPTQDATGRVAGFADATGRHLPLVCTLNATRVTDMVAAWLGTDAAGLGDLALGADESGRRPIVVPWFDGERTPNVPNGAGQLLELTTATTAADIALAAHDGVLCGLLDGVDALIEAGVQVNGQLHLIGGGARSAAYRQRCADLWGRPVVRPDADETVATGAAVQAAAIALDEPLAETQGRWALGAGDWVHPRHGVDAVAIRDRHRHATAHAMAFA